MEHQYKKAVNKSTFFPVSFTEHIFNHRKEQKVQELDKDRGAGKDGSTTEERQV